MLNVEFVFVLIVVVTWKQQNFGLLGNPISKEDREIMPWLGILKVKLGSDKREAATGITLIHSRIGVAVAGDVAKVSLTTLSKVAEAVFFKNKEPWSCGVHNYILHPEFYDGVLNTLALVYLSSNKEDTYWIPINWPVDSKVEDNVFIYRLYDNPRRINQVSHRMEAVKRNECISFYKHEELDYKSLQPAHCACYKVMYSDKPCVVDAGVPLVARTQSSWLLIGISTHGPSCSLPSRFIQYFPYIPWIKSNIFLKKKDFRRFHQGMEEPYEDLDSMLLSKINDDSIALRPSLAYLKEEVYGRCDSKDGFLMYREFGTIRTPDHTATGVYSISLYDLSFGEVTCVMVTVMCDKRSEVKFWFDTGFHQEDIEDYIRIIPSPKRNNTKAPKILYIKDTYKGYRNIEMANLDFKFEFTNEAKLDLEFYGLNRSRFPDISINNLISPPAIGQSRTQFNSDMRSSFTDLDDNHDLEKDSFYFF